MSRNLDDPRLTAYALGEMLPGERDDFEAELLDWPDGLREVDEIRQAAAILAGELGQEPGPDPALPGQRAAADPASKPPRLDSLHPDSLESSRAFRRILVLAGALATAAGAVLAINSGWLAPKPAPDRVVRLTVPPPPSLAESAGPAESADLAAVLDPGKKEEQLLTLAVHPEPEPAPQLVAKAALKTEPRAFASTAPVAAAFPVEVAAAAPVKVEAAAPVKVADDLEPAEMRRNRFFLETSPDAVSAAAPGLPQSRPPSVRNASPQLAARGLARAAQPEQELIDGTARPDSLYRLKGFHREGKTTASLVDGFEAYEAAVEGDFQPAAQEPLSTFSLDVDTAAYSNIRRILNQGLLPPPQAVRIEEMLNYFDYAYPAPAGDATFSVTAEVADCPWKPGHRLARFGIRARALEGGSRPPANLVFLIDVSGSMDEPAKLPLVKNALRLLLDTLRGEDRVAIVTYATDAALALAPTPCDHKASILDAINRLQAAGSTNGAAGIQMAYEAAALSEIRGGINRVILATDGDFNVGIVDPGELTRLIEAKARGGVFLSVLGFGYGNLKDAVLERLADRGNGHYAYLDTLQEAFKVLVREAAGTLAVVAKDVKVQIEFNPAQAAAYRLIGYDNRLLRREDFRDDSKDAGEVGSGRMVTALYEIVPAGAAADAGAETLRYQKPEKPAPLSAAGAGSGELLSFKLRYKDPDGQASRQLEAPVTDRGTSFSRTSADFKFAAAVAAFGMVLRESHHKGSADYQAALRLAEEGLGNDPDGRRAEFIRLVRLAQSHSQSQTPSRR